MDRVGITSRILAGAQRRTSPRRHTRLPGPPLPAEELTTQTFQTGNQVQPECVNFASSLRNVTGTFVRTVAPNGDAGPTPELTIFDSGSRVKSLNLEFTANRSSRR
jgi:hypothetical protein